MAEETGVGILLVEDNDIDRDICTRVLKRAGFRVVAASSYEEATAALDRDDGLALMITDVRLPVVHGFMLARMAVARRPLIKILYFTGLTERRCTRRASRWGGSSRNRAIPNTSSAR